MASKVLGISGVLLKWARESAGLSREQIAHAMKKPVEVIEDWESDDNESFPTYVQLEKLAYSLYKRPLAVFFFPEPPDEIDPRREFRLLPAFEIEALDPDTLLAARQAQSMQASLYELTGGQNPSENPIFKLINARKFRSISPLCKKVRAHLGVSMQEQQTWSTLREAFNSWREAIENSGIYIFKRSFKEKAISGFCLNDDEFPVIFVNNSTSDSRQIFTLFHELAHILFSTSSITKFDSGYIEALPDDERRIEIVCNQFASEILVPSEVTNEFLTDITGTDEEVSYIANKLSVSREVILRKLLDLEMVSQSHYESRRIQWNKEWEERERQPGGRYYATQATYLGKGFLRLAFNNYYAGRCSLQELASHLNIKAKNVERLEAFVIGGL